MLMPRKRRNAPGGLVYHVLNRGVGRGTLFHKEQDYFAFERVLQEVMHELRTRLLAFCLMPNHWHFALWPRSDHELSDFVGRVTHVHTQRWHAHYHTSGTGHLYQGRFKSFPVQSDPHLLLMLRYIERNPLRAGRGCAGGGLAFLQPVSATSSRRNGTAQRRLPSSG